MVDPRSSRFWQIARRAGLLETEQLEACWNAIPSDKRTADAIDRRLARQAVNTGLLTLWQAQQVLAGRSQGLRIDRYVLLDQIGSGGMGRVYLARDTRLGRHVAIKILSRERMSNPRALARFKREAKVGAQLQHENLIRIYDEGDLQGMPYLVMEYITGQTVGQMIADHGRIEPSLAADLGKQVALGLDHLHQKGLLHRDVNPTNILIDRGGSAKLSDLGLAIDLGDVEDVVTRDGATVGTFDYISPEQARNPRQIDTRSDIYSLGCTLYHMLSGRVPFPAPSLPEKLFAHQSKEAEPLVGQVAGLPPGLDAVVRKMMSKSPEERYARPSLVARALEAFARPTHGAFDEPSTPRQRRDTPPSVEAEVRGESDPDLAILPVHGTRVPQEATSDPFEFVKIDLGPEGPLSETRSAARSRSQEGPRPLFSTPWVWVAATALVVSVIVLLLFLTNRGGGTTPVRANQELAKRPPAAVAPTSPIVVEYEDGTRIGVDSLQEAVRRASGRLAKVLLRGDEPIKVGSVAAQQLRIASGSVTIQAADEVNAVLEVTVNANAPAIVVNTNSMLTLHGLTIVVERKLTDAAAAPAVLHCSGNLKLDRCALVVKGSDHRMRGVLFEGNRFVAQGCFIQGFETPVAVNGLSGIDVRLSECILSGRPEADASAIPNAGWAVSFFLRPTRRNATRKLTLEHSTFAGTGLLRVDGAVDQATFQVDISSCVVMGQALAMWPLGAFPGSMTWRGKSNVYGVTGEDWLVAAPGGARPSTDPGSLEGWSKPTSVSEDNSREAIVRLRVEADRQKPEDFKIVDPADVKAGADTAQFQWLHGL